jgi:hypothetical protein
VLACKFEKMFNEQAALKHVSLLPLNLRISNNKSRATNS